MRSAWLVLVSIVCGTSIGEAHITVYDVLDYLTSGMSQKVLRDFTDLRPMNVRHEWPGQLATVQAVVSRHGWKNEP